MTDGGVLLAAASGICVAAFLIGLRFRRGWWMSHGDAQQSRSLGLLMMAAAPLLLLFFAALCFGLLGPVEGITPIQFPSE